MNEIISSGRNYCNLYVTKLKQFRITVNQLELSCFSVYHSQLRCNTVTFNVIFEIIPSGRNFCNLNVTMLKQSSINVNRLELTSCFMYLGASYSVTP